MVSFSTGHLTRLFCKVNIAASVWLAALLSLGDMSFGEIGKFETNLEKFFGLNK
jgi:hypothetical protein